MREEFPQGCEDRQKEMKRNLRTEDERDKEKGQKKKGKSRVSKSTYPKKKRFPKGLQSTKGGAKQLSLQESLRKKRSKEPTSSIPWI